MAEDHVTLSPVSKPQRGPTVEQLSEEELLRQLEHLHSTRHEMFLHASTQAMVAHSERQHLLEDEYLRRHPDRDIDPVQLGHRPREHT